MAYIEGPRNTYLVEWTTRLGGTRRWARAYQAENKETAIAYFEEWWNGSGQGKLHHAFDIKASRIEEKAARFFKGEE